MFRNILIFLLTAILAGGCTKEDLGQCTGFRLMFEYTYNKQNQNLLTIRIHDIRVYIFDQSTGLLVKIVRVGDASIARGWVDVDLPDGVYTASAWAGSSTDMMQAGFMDAEMDNPASQLYKLQATIGHTTLQNFRMMLAYNALTGGEIAPKIEQFDDLFFAMAQNISVKTGGRNQTVKFDFLKNTSILKVKISGLERLWSYDQTPAHPLNVFVTGKNGRYNYDNKIDAYAQQVHYEPPYTALTASEMDIDIKELRLDIYRNAAYPSLLHIVNPVTGQDMVPPLNIIDMILSAKDKNTGAYIWKNQDDIDREEEFPIEISILYDLSVSVSVNGFEVVNTSPDISRPKIENRQ